MVLDTDVLAQQIRDAGEEGALRVLQGTVVDDTPPTPAHSRVQLADGRIVSVRGMCAVGSEVTVHAGKGFAQLPGVPRFGVIATRAATQSIPNASGTDIIWTAASMDTHSYIVLPSSVATARHPGAHSISATIDATVGLQNRCYLEIRIDGSITRRARLPFTGNGEDRATVSTSPVLAVGDTVVVQFYHASGAARSVTATLDMQRITY